MITLLLVLNNDIIYTCIYMLNDTLKRYFFMIIKDEDNLNNIIVQKLTINNSQKISDNQLIESEYLKTLLNKASDSLIKGKYERDYNNDINNYDYMLISSELKLSDGSTIHIDSIAIKDKVSGSVIASGSPTLNPDMNQNLPPQLTDNINHFLNNPLEEYDYLKEKYMHKKSEEDLKILKETDAGSVLLQQYIDMKDKYRNQISYFNLSDFTNIQLNNNITIPAQHKNLTDETPASPSVEINGMEFGDSQNYNSINHISYISLIAQKEVNDEDLATVFHKGELLASLQESINKRKLNKQAGFDMNNTEYMLISGVTKFEDPLKKTSFDIGIEALALKDKKTGQVIVAGNPVIDEETLVSISKNPEKYGANKNNSFGLIEKIKKTFNNPMEDYHFNLESFKHNEKNMTDNEKNTLKKIFSLIEESNFFKEFNKVKNLNKTSVNYFNISDYLKHKIQGSFIPDLKSLRDKFIQSNDASQCQTVDKKPKI